MSGLKYKKSQGKGKPKWLLGILIGVFALQMSCGFLFRDGDGDLSATLSALRAQQTDLAGTLSAFTAVASAGSSTQIVQSTIEASLATATAQQALVSTLSSHPNPTINSPGSYPDERMLKSAKILLFEDMSASRYIRIVKETLDQNGYFYQDVGSAKGWFKSMLLSDVEWDLVIAAAEADREFGGEFFEYIDDRIASGTAAIVENWDFDLAPNGKAGGLLARCGVRFQLDWYEPQMRALFWLTQDSPVFTYPNRIKPALHNSKQIWNGDLGDLLAVDRDLSGNGGDPLLLAGLNPNWKESHAVLVSCLGGRLILQTFRTHEYSHDEMVELWENYIYQTLRSYFTQSGKVIPTPSRKAPIIDSTSTPLAPTPGPEYNFAHGCDGFFQVKFTKSPVFQKDLFEHHTDGQYLILRAQVKSLADFPIMIWDGDYSVKAQIEGQDVEAFIDPDATGYLFIEDGGQLVQGIIEPGDIWNLSLAFDVSSNAAPWTFHFQPGREFDGPICEAKVDITR